MSNVEWNDEGNGVLTWKKHIYRVNVHQEEGDTAPLDTDRLRKRIEPWLSAVFQSEHLSLLVGSGFTKAIAAVTEAKAAGMDRFSFTGELAEFSRAAADDSARGMARGEANFEDDLRTASELLRGLDILSDERAAEWREQINDALIAYLKSIMEGERLLADAFSRDSLNAISARNLLISFLLSFASRAASRERLNIFTTNYDRLIEFGCDLAGLRVIDRFVGALKPVFRTSRLNIDLHYNPPGMRGEPRYLEGVIRFFKLHGSIDWRAERSQIRRYGIPFGPSVDTPYLPSNPIESVMIYPNAAKDIETSQFPYAELFRDFASTICRPNSVLVTYGYGFGDDHINRVIRDMLTVPSSHLVIISYDNPGERIKRFYNDIGHSAQITLLIGKHFGNLPVLVENYLPKPAIDLISAREMVLLEGRRDAFNSEESHTPTPEATKAEKED